MSDVSFLHQPMNAAAKREAAEREQEELEAQSALEKARPRIEKLREEGVLPQLLSSKEGESDE